MPRLANRHPQHGAVIVTVALAMLFLLGFMGIALDFGRLFIVKTELQTAMDSCALAAAQELDGQTTAITRAQSAGLAAGNLNNVNLQSASWSGKGKLSVFDVTFRDAGYMSTTAPTSARYAECAHTQPEIQTFLLKAMATVSGNTTDFPNQQSVAARAVATRGSAQTSCMLPIGVCDKPGGFQPGEWVQGAVGAGDALTGQFHWLDFTGNAGGANDVKALLQGQGQCSLPGADSVVRESGNIGSAAFAYNTRFGIYQGSKAPPVDGIPDMTGYAYYNNTVTQPPYPNRYNFPTNPSNSFVAKRSAYAKYQGDNKSDNPALNVIPPGKIDSGSLATSGANRRIATVPIVNCPIPNSSSTPVKINRVACILLLHPIKTGAAASSEKMWIEYLGAANDPVSPCASSGLPGGTAGPLVTVLVR